MPKQSRFTANSMFQRQLSTTALNSSTVQGQGQSVASSSGSGGATSAVAGRQSSATSGGGGPRLFQRQMTASQLFSSSASRVAADEPPSSAGSRQQRSGAHSATISRPAGSDLVSASSVLCLNSQQAGSGVAASALSRSTRRLTGDQDDQQQPKKPAKNKRIISRMLSISAIQTSVGLSGLSGGVDHAGSTNNQQGGGFSGSSDFAGSHHGERDGLLPASMTGDQAADKIDSSFTRSRSSSCSSSTAPNEGGHQSVGEAIHCLCFLDWSQASQAPAAWQRQQQGGPQAVATGSGGGGVGVGAGLAHQQSGAHTSATNNKSLSSIDGSSAGQLVLWLGTSQGSVLLVSLAMPDSEDNRVLQLQSVNAEPIPQAALKMPGAIICLSVFGSERHAGHGQLGGSQSSSLETEVAAAAAGNSGANPEQLGSSSSNAGSGSPYPAGGVAGGQSGSSGSAGANLRDHDSAAHHHSSFDSRAFLAVVSEKQAKVFQVPVSNSNKSSASSSSSSSDQHSHHNPFHLHHHMSSSPSQQQQQQQQQPGRLTPSSASGPQSADCDTPMAKFLTNKANCIAKADLSDSSFVCRSAIVQMRQPDECCLVNYLATGNLVVRSLPMLRPLYDADFAPYTSARIASSMQFSRNGHCLYQPSTGEISKFTLSAHYKSLVDEMTGLLYVPRDMPEMPRANFFKSLFAVATSSASSRQSERDELFGECSAGKPSRGVAKHIGGGASSSTGLEKLKSSAVGTMGHDMRVAREGLDERGEKLGEIEDKTLAMLNQSESYSQAAHQLAQKFKDKKWYQF